MQKGADRRRFTIDEIEYYLKGCVLVNGGGQDLDADNRALKLAICLLSDKASGIEAVAVRHGSPAKDPLKELSKACDKAIVALHKASFGLNAALSRLEKGPS